MISLLRKIGTLGAYMVALFLLLCLVLGQFKYALPETLMVFAFCVVCIVTCCYINSKKRIKVSDRLFGVITALLIIIAFCAEVYIVNHVPFGWASDPITCKAQAEYMFNVWELRPETADYFYMYPHNINLIFILGSLYRLLGDYNLVIYVFLLLTNFSSLLSCLTIYNITGNKFISLFTLLLLQVFCVFTTRTYMPYTSNMAILFPILMVYIYTSKMSARNKCIIIPIVAALAYQAKLTALIPFIAIAVIEIIRCVKNRGTNNRKMVHIALLSTFSAFMLFACAKNICWDSIGYVKDETRYKDFAYYLYLGQNTQSSGQWDQEYVNNGDLTAPISERDAYYYSVAKRDFIERGLLGNMKFYVAKSVICWGCTYMDYTNFEGKDSHWIYSLRHCIWFLVFACAMLSIFICRNRYNLTMLLALTGVMIYLFLSEGSFTFVIMFSQLVFAMAGIMMSRLNTRLFKQCNTHQ